MINKQKIILFGAGEKALTIFNYIYNEYDIIAFVDNDLRVQGKTINNLKVIDPNSINKLDFDYVIVASMFDTAITSQLFYDLNIDLEKIRYVD